MPFEVIMGQDSILRIFLSGDLDEVLLDRFNRDLAPFIGASTPEQPLKRMVYFQGIEQISPALRRYLASLNQDERIGKTAYIKPSRHARVLAQFINKATGRENIATFDQEDEALKWFRIHHK
ncbi:MAG: hypothetical protein JW757_01530 [Anaerolineales bacterium]|nr:hypothetical protein [Anaerolineales bacterium]